MLVLPEQVLAWPTGIGIFSREDPDHRHRCASLVPFAPVEVHVIGFQLGSVRGWEAAVHLGHLELTVLGVELNPPQAVNVGQIGNFIVALGGDFAGDPSFTFVSYQLGWFAGTTAPQDVQVCLGPATPSSFAGMPGYATASSQLVPLGYVSPDTGIYAAGCAVLNPSDAANCEFPYANEAASFGAIKARF
jgi:hypothetical protein